MLMPEARALRGGSGARDPTLPQTGGGRERPPPVRSGPPALPLGRIIQVIRIARNRFTGSVKARSDCFTVYGLRAVESWECKLRGWDSMENKT